MLIKLNRCYFMPRVMRMTSSSSSPVQSSTGNSNHRVRRAQYYVIEPWQVSNELQNCRINASLSLKMKHQFALQGNIKINWKHSNLPRISARSYTRNFKSRTTYNKFFNHFWSKCTSYYEELASALNEMTEKISTVQSGGVERESESLITETI